MTLPHLLALGALLALVALGCVRLAGAFGSRIGRGAPWIVVVVVLLLAPWLRADRLISPTNLLLRGMLPGIDVPVEPTHQLLNDAFLQFLPWEADLRAQWSRGEPAFWSPSLEGGSSLWVNPQAGVLSPIALAARAFPLRQHLLVALALKLTLGALGTVALARATGCRLLPSMLAAIAFLLSGPLITWGLFPHTAALAFVPWVMLSSLRLARSPSPRRLVLGSLLLAALLLSGHPEVAFVGGLAAATLAVALRRRSLGLQAILAWNAASVLLGLLLASPSLLPFLLQLPEAQRFHEMAEAPQPETAVLGFEPSRVDLLRSLWTPYAYGRPYLDDFAGGSNWAEALSGAPGAIVLLGAVLFLVAPSRRSRPLRHPGPALFVCACWLAAAGWGPLVALLKSLPLLSVLEYRRSLLVVGVLLAVFAAHGLSALLARQGRRTLLLTAVLGALALLMGARDAEPIAWLVLLAAALPWPLGGPRRAALVAAAIVLAQVPWAWRMLPRSAPESFFPTSPLVEKVAARTAVEDGRYRVVGSGYELYPSLLPLWGLDEVRPHNPMAPWAQTELLARTFDFRSQTSSGAYFSAFGHLDDPLLDYLNVGAVIQPAQDAAPEGWPVLAELGNRRAVVNPDALPRWFAPTTWLRAPRRPAGSPARAVTFEGCPELDPLQSERSADPVVLSRDSDDVRLSLGSSFPELLATSVPWSTGWQATSEEGPLQTCRINEAFLGVVVPPGTATLWLRYEPPGLRTGSALSALALVSLGGLWTRRRRPVS